MIRTRFAPSPTGYLHLGGARTALYSWLYARKQHGEFILRIEDTDAKRSSPKYLNSIIESLEWLGINWDGEVYFQSKRIEIYKEYAKKLISSGRAYYCFCPAKGEERKEEKELENCSCINLPSSKTKELENSNIPKVIRFKVPKESVKLYDLVREEITFQSDTISDFVILKSDGIATYNFAVVIDDALMKITHIIRGDDHISNTPRQLMLYKALDFKIPKYVHLSMILGSDRKRLSKRHGATSVTYFKENGYLPQALINYLSLLGWSTSDSQQILSKEDLLNKFSLKGISKNPAIFDYDKMLWMNGQYIRKMGIKELTNRFIDYLKKEKIYLSSKDKWYQEIAALHQSRIRTIRELLPQTSYLLNKDIEIEEDAANSYLNSKKTIEILKEVREFIALASDFSSNNLEEVLRNLIAKLKIEAKEIIHPLRVALTGTTASPGIFEVIHLLGKEKVLRRIDKVIQRSE
ncbi:MAG: glutamate--tRNA ligase [bacterium]|nr:glutamate--tRNA ligase [bacterium]